MENCDVEQCPNNTNDNDNFKEKQSAENFQKFMYDLFEKNGILNDLRAYLRGHIIDVLRSARTGEPPTCQKHFSQRLELLYQAMNMLIAEYLLRLDFNYSMSVFVSEIPLANMVFEFAKDLMKNNNGDVENLKFEVGDVWSILNYLGIKCDSKYATDILEMYEKENLPLVICILKCQEPRRHYRKSTSLQGALPESSSSSVKSSDSLERDRRTKSACKVASAHEQCRHSKVCKFCQTKMDKLREKYKSKKEHIFESIRSMDLNDISIKMLMSHMGEMEQHLIDEMFEQLQSVYEAEIDMLKRNEEKKIRSALASHALQLQRQKEEMEEAFKKREKELEKNIQDKKKFLWELALSLREQHAQMSRAMLAVREETEKLTNKERSLDTQLSEAENILKQRGEEIRKQIFDELKVLECQLDNMKKERDNISKERAELEQIKNSCNNNDVNKAHDKSNDELRSHHDLFKDEFSLLKKYLETSKFEPKCVIERSTLTELSNVTSRINIVLNNEQSVVKNHLKCDTEDKIKSSNQVVNDLKKLKNVNFRKPDTAEVCNEKSRGRSCCRYSASSRACEGIAMESEGDRDLVQRLRDENERLRAFASQQREHIDELSSHRARLQAELTAVRFREIPAPASSRPRTAPAYMAFQSPAQYRLDASPSAKSVGWRKGAGEEISMFANSQPRILLPGDTIPFIGVLQDRHNDNRRHLINQWRASRRRISPTAATKPRIASSSERDTNSKYDPANPIPRKRSPPHLSPVGDTFPQVETEDSAFPDTSTRERTRISVAESPQQPQPRAKSPQSVLKEAKEKLKNYVRDHPAHASTTRDKSPSSVLREAKKRLRKLEIEAEAVEKSYLDFRRRQQLKEDRDDVDNIADLGENLQSKREVKGKEESRLELSDLSSPVRAANYANEYAKLNTMSYFRNRISALSNIKPIPSTLKNIELELTHSEQIRDNYLESPLSEFRKLYHSQRSVVAERSPKIKANIHKENIEDVTQTQVDKEQSIKDTEKNSQFKSLKINEDDLETLKGNLTAIDHYDKEDTQEKNIPVGDIDTNYNRDNDIKIQESQDTSKGKSTIAEVSPVSIVFDIINEKPEKSIEIPKIEEHVHVNDDSNVNEKPVLQVIVESSIDTKQIDISQTDMGETIPTQMTIIVSPKRTENVTETEYPEQVVNLTKHDALNAIFHSEAKSSIEIELNISKETVEKSSEIDKGDEDYADDFSPEVENNSLSQYEINSSISLPKNSEDDNFWATN